MSRYTKYEPISLYAKAGDYLRLGPVRSSQDPDDEYDAEVLSGTILGKSTTEDHGKGDAVKAVEAPGGPDVVYVVKVIAVVRRSAKVE